MRIQIKHCNNIDNAEIEIKENVLNIKYAINGTGKSTIAKAIISSVNDRKSGTKSLTELTPFKYLASNEANPEVSGIDSINQVMIFDEKYINEFAFQPNELLKGSFDVFIKGEKYDNGMKEIDERVKRIKEMLGEDKDISELIVDFNEISSSFGKPTKTGIHGASKLATALKDGNKVTHIPNGLEGYKTYIQHPDNYKWLKWQLDGKNYLEISTDCPYCTSDIQTKKTVISRVAEVYEPKAIENLNKIINVFERLKEYFSRDAQDQIDQFISNLDGYSESQIRYLNEIRSQIEGLAEQFTRAQRLGFLSLKNVDQVIVELKTYKIDINLYVHLKSEKTIAKVNIVNEAIDEIIKEASELQGSVAKQKILIERLIEENCTEINDFLETAGYNYSVNLIEDGNGQHNLKLLRNDVEYEVPNAKNHLSFGERNAFSLVLFMYHALKLSPSLIILDDPISSFDKNKKYAIVEMLFRKKKSFSGKTVLLLTHDLDPIVDMVRHHPDKFTQPFATFLENKNGELSEKQIQKSNIQTHIEINLKNLHLEIPFINRLVYLRRQYEVLNTKDNAYELLSNLLHKRDTPVLKKDGTDQTMSKEQIEEATRKITEHISDFDYKNFLEVLKNDIEMKEHYFNSSNNYEKLHLFRIIYDDKPDDIKSNIIQKFINEAFHIENNYIYQLNPRDFQLVPQYIINECDQIIEALT